ncbi:MAG: SHOCT domain-containing protein [Bacillota bacterium]
MMGSWGMGFGGGLFGIFYMLIPLLLLGAVIYWAVKAGTQHITPSGQQTPSRRPVEIANERYAKGEISSEQLEEIRNNLQK